MNNRSIVADARRIALIDPTKFLGNLLLSGGLIQQLAHWCAATDRQMLLVLDESFESLTEGAFPGVQRVFYPRKALAPGAPRLQGIKAWLRCLGEIRRFRADLAFTIEEDSVCHRLTHFSGARCKVSSTIHRYHWGFDHVLDIPRNGRAAEEASIWYSVRDVFAALGIPVSGAPSYLQLAIGNTPESARDLFQRLNLDEQKPLLLIHAGASKAYKQWPISSFAEVAVNAIDRGYQVGLIGAGRADQAINSLLLEKVGQARAGTQDCHDLCNQLGLVALAQLMLL
ncbi:MAG TPA: glycosyltransferase family 9 protein, partial [Pseudohongiella sp.]|nr:glycosyltransferase family 9 protein [Pseudohongiella sp.]